MLERPDKLNLFLLPPNVVLLPGVTVSINVGGSENTAIISRFYNDLSTRHSISNIIGCVTSTDSRLFEGTEKLNNDLDITTEIKKESSDAAEVGIYNYGCTAKFVQLERLINGRYQVTMEGLYRFKVTTVNQNDSDITANVKYFHDNILDVSDIKTYTLIAQLKRLSRDLIAVLTDNSSLGTTAKYATPYGLETTGTIFWRRLQSLVDRSSSQDAIKVANIMVFAMDIPAADKISMLKIDDTLVRIERAIELISRQLNLLAISRKIKTSVDTSINKKQRELLLRQQLKEIKRELGEKDNDSKEDDDIADLEKKLENIGLPKEAERVVQRELKRLKRMHPTQAEYQVCRTYLETIADIPWSTATTDKIDSGSIRAAKDQLDKDHYGLDAVKKRLLEYLAVIRLKSRDKDVSIVEKAPIILLVGPPGVGKTSLARSVAEALGRKFHRISLGGVRDEAEIRGHRRTYVGAMPGLLVQGLRKVGVINPVILLDEIDKLGGNNFHGDPSAAMLEILDPEQNHTFTDHYLNMPIDLSKSLFIATANSLESISAPLLDRMETIVLSGYTFLEKEHIARQFLVPKQVKANGLTMDKISVPDEVLLKIATCYTREAGVRNLEREIATLCRGKAVEYAESLDNPGSRYDPVIGLGDLTKYLGIEKFEDEVFEGNARPGVVTGLAYMGSGNGGLLLIEASRIPTSHGGGLQLTGNLGEVIKESARIALTWVRAHGQELHLLKDDERDPLGRYDIHIHAPAGAIPKDGPSAGIAMTLAIVSLLQTKPVPSNIAMTGEMTLRGQVLPVGGIREKVLAAHRAGIRKVILPSRNRKDVEMDMPVDIKRDMDFAFVNTIGDVISSVWPETSNMVAFMESHL
ncbi:Lon protease C-terminal proteolytic domain-containing protein [Dipodascopsis uninucleata]